MATKNYLGYPSLEEWAKAVDRSRPVFACSTTHPGKQGKFGMRVDRGEIVCSQPDARGDVHYCLLTIGSWSELVGQPAFGAPLRKQVLDKQAQVWDLVKAWLGEQRFEVRHAIVAIPRTLVLLDGWAEFLGFDKVQGKFYRRDFEPSKAQETRAPVAVINVEALLEA